MTPVGATPDDALPERRVDEASPASDAANANRAPNEAPAEQKFKLF
jgi:hypothetical protein